MTFDDAVESTGTREEAINEVILHYGTSEEFLIEVGDKPEYSGREVLEWLGY